MTTVAALYVMPGGPYANLPDVEVWDEARDARKYAGPHPVVCHSPCDRWGRYARGGPNPKARRFEIGADGGCFEHAIWAVREFGGVLEHPATSHAWRRFGLLVAPPHSGGWIPADTVGGWTCCVEQGHFGHPARKATWLYAVRCDLPSLPWGPSAATQRLELGPRSKEEARAIRAAPGYLPIKRLTVTERLATPAPFRDLLLTMARSARPPT